MAPSSTKAHTVQGLLIVDLLQKIKSGELKVERLSHRAKKVLVGYLSGQGYLSEKIASLLKCPGSSVRYWRAEHEADVVKLYRDKFDNIAGGLILTASAVIDHLRESGDWLGLWRVKKELAQELRELGVIPKIPDTHLLVPISIEEAFENVRKTTAKNVDAKLIEPSADSGKPHGPPLSGDSGALGPVSA